MFTKFPYYFIITIDIKEIGVVISNGDIYGAMCLFTSIASEACINIYSIDVKFATSRDIWY